MIKKILIAAGALVIIASVMIWYAFNLKYENTKNVKADYTVMATALLKEYRENTADANKKYTEKILSVKGTITEIEKADTSYNIKMVDSAGAYLIFAMQHQNNNDVKQLKEDQEITVKGSCSGGTFSKILDIVYVAFKRCIIEK